MEHYYYKNLIFAIFKDILEEDEFKDYAHAIAYAEAAHLPTGAIEFQMLYGMAEPVRAAVQKMGYRVRVYSPVGKLIPGMAYLVRRLLENTSNESFLRRSFEEKIPFEELIKSPQYSGVQGRTSGEEGISLRKEDFRNEPPVDYSKGENRERMLDSLRKIRTEFNKEYPLHIGGEAVWADRETLSLNPARPGEVVGRRNKRGRRKDCY